MPNRKTNDRPENGNQNEHRAAEPAGPAEEAARPAAGDAPGHEPRDPAAALDAAEAEIGRLKDQLLRALAETENVRRRGQREREDASKFALTAFAKDLLPVADNLRRALESIPPEALETDESLRNLAEGVAMTERQMLTAFERHGIRRVEPLGERFDSNFHQAMFEVPGSGQPAGTVVQLMQPGYLLHDRLLRPAMVGVAKGEPAPESGPGGGPEGGSQGGGEAPPGGRVDTTA